MDYNQTIVSVTLNLCHKPLIYGRKVVNNQEKSFRKRRSVALFSIIRDKSSFFLITLKIKVKKQNSQSSYSIGKMESKFTL